jgi:hypothetical protein
MVKNVRYNVGQFHMRVYSFKSEMMFGKFVIKENVNRRM